MLQAQPSSALYCQNLGSLFRFTDGGEVGFFPHELGVSHAIGTGFFL